MPSDNYRDSSRREMPFAFVHRVEDETELPSVREHMNDWDGTIWESYNTSHEMMHGESLHIVTWEVCSP